MERAFGRNASADLDVRFLYTQALLDGLAATAAVLGVQHPLPVGISESLNGDHANPSLVVTTVTWTEAHAPASLSAVSHRSSTNDIANLLGAACRDV